jgi:hypothetical protein
MVTLRKALGRALSRAIRITGGLALGWLLVHWLTGGIGSMTMVEPPAGAEPPPSHIVSLIEAKQQRLEANGQCWSGPAPRDVTYPGSVLLVRIVAGERVAVRVTNDHIVDTALTQVLGGPDAGLTVLAFCR